MMIAVASLAVRCPVGRGRNITLYSTVSDVEKKAWLTQLLCSLIILLQGYTDPQLERFSTGGRLDCLLLSILRSLSGEQLEELRPALESHVDSTHAPSAPSVPMLEATTSILAEMATTEYSFLQQSLVRPQAPLLPKVIPQPKLSQAELIELRCARADLDRMRLAMDEQGKMLVSVTSRMYNAEEEVKR